MNKTHPNIWLFIDSIRNEVETVHGLIVQIGSGMRPPVKRSQSRLVEDRMKELYHRYDNNKITPRELLKKLSFFVANQK